MNITSLTLGPLSTNCYIVSADSGGEAVVIDPAAGAPRIHAALEGRTVAAVLLTHGHFDHTGALAAFADKPICIHRLDAPMLSDPYLSVGEMVHDRKPRPAAARLLEDGMTLELAGLEIHVIHTPGHTMGGVTYRIGDALFTGDTMFRGSYGRTDFPGGSLETEMASIRKLLALPGDLPVYPGHGPATTIADERKTYQIWSQ